MLNAAGTSDQPNTRLARVGSVIALVGLVSAVISTALDYWYDFKGSDGDVTGEIYFGLWEFCISGAANGNKGKVCTDWSTVESAGADIGWLKACQAFMVSACILLGVGIFFGLLFAMYYRSRKPMLITAGCFCVVAGSLALAAVIIFAAKYESSLSDLQTGGNLYAGFYLAIISTVTAKVGGYLILRNRVVFLYSYP